MKNRYCKLCGGAIDLATKKCTSCGKQYFKVPKLRKILSFSLIIAALCASASGNFLQYQNYEKRISSLGHDLKYKDSIISQNQNTIEQKNELIKDKENQISNLKNALYDSNTVAEFYETAVGITIINDFTYFHQVTCTKVYSDNIVHISSVEELEREGFIPCEKCYVNFAEIREEQREKRDRVLSKIINGIG